MRHEKLTPQDKKQFRWYARNGLKTGEILNEYKPPSPFDCYFERARQLPCYELVLGAWLRAMCLVTGGPAPDEGRETWEKDHFLYLIWLAGDEGLGDGDAEAGRELRLARMEEARKAGDRTFANQIKDAHRHRDKGEKDADKNEMEAPQLILGLWLHFSLWAMDDFTSLTVACNLKKGGTPRIDPLTWERRWRQARRRLKLVTWRKLGMNRPLLKYKGDVVIPTPKVDAGKYYLGCD